MERQMLEMRQELTMLKAQASSQSPGPSPAVASPASLSPRQLGYIETPPPSTYPMHPTFLPHPPLSQTNLDATHSSVAYRPDVLLTPPDDSSPRHTHFLGGQCTPGSGSEAGSTNLHLALSSPSPPVALVTPEPFPRLLAARPGSSSSGVGPHLDFVEGSSSQPYMTPSHSPAISIAEKEDQSDVTYTSPAVAVRATLASDVQEGSLSPASVALGKRRTPPASSGGSSASSEDEDVLGVTDNTLRKRQNGHDKRCLTIHVSEFMALKPMAHGEHHTACDA